MRTIIWILILIALFICVPRLARSVEASITPKFAPGSEETLTPRDYSVWAVLNEFGGSQWTYFNRIVDKESNWNNEAQNPRSSAYGLCQFLNSTWQGEKTSDPYIQIDECIIYIAERYDTPEKAWKFHKRKNWF